MGFIYADIKLANHYDQLLVLDNIKKESEVRSVSIRALVDTGAVTLAINETIKNQLGLRVYKRAPVQTATGAMHALDVVGPVEIIFKDRTCHVDAYVLPGDSEVLLGCIPLEYMDLKLDPKKETIDINPDFPKNTLWKMKSMGTTDFKNISLSGKKIDVSNKDMTFMEKIYLPAIAKGMGITLRHFFKPKVTTQYPEQKREFSPVYRGRHILMRDENGAERCTACGLCALSCPAEAITMTSGERKKGEENLYREEKYATAYEINMLRCIFCGLCEEACPKEAIFLTEDLVAADYRREGFIFGKDKLVMPLEDKKH